MTDIKSTSQGSLLGLTTFKAITSFVNELGKVFGKRHKPLKLYCRLINKTLFSCTKVIEKHISVFRGFCIANRDAIVSRGEKKLVQRSVIYSQNVHIDFGLVL